MSNRADAAAKDAEGKAKQVQASVMNAAEDLKDSAGSMARQVSGAAARLADDRG